MVASDGYKNKYALGGTPLINFCLLLPDKALFHKVITAAGVVKNAEWIRDQHLAIARDTALFATPEDCVGFVMDNAKANTNAMQLLREVR